MTNAKISPTMRAAIDHAIKHGNGDPEAAILVRFPGGFWSHRGWKGTHQVSFGTTTIEAIVERGAGVYVAWRYRKNGSKFPIVMKVTL